MTHLIDVERHSLLGGNLDKFFMYKTDNHNRIISNTIKVLCNRSSNPRDFLNLIAIALLDSHCSKIRYTNLIITMHLFDDWGHRGV